jgi:acetyl-CoA acetyltransferase
MADLDACIVAAAITEVGVFPDATATELAARALREALLDTSLERSAIDGLVWNLGRPSGEDYPALVNALGLNLRFVNQFWTHGRWTGSAVAVAALAVSTGLADVVACLGAAKRAPSSGGAFAWHIYEQAAFAFRRYLDIYDVDRERIADVVLAQREFARRNDRAYLRDPLSREEYASLPETISPFREPDRFPATDTGGPRNDYGVCVLVTRHADAASHKRVSVLAAQGVQAGREEMYFGRPGLGLMTQTATAFAPSSWDLRVFRDADIEPTDVDVFYTYDAFSSLVWFALERFGHCAAGEAPEFATIDRIGPGGSFPINTNGGILSEGHTAGWGAIVEMVRQLRDEAGARQVKGATLAQWGSVFGDALILGTDYR